MENKNFYENITIFKIEYVCVYVYLNYNKKWFNHLFKFGNNKNYNMSTKISNNLLKSTNRGGGGGSLKKLRGDKKNNTKHENLIKRACFYLPTLRAFLSL